jgi:hypothetical protein
MNEPVNYLLAGYGAGYFPPGKRYLLSEENLLGKFVPVVRTYLRMHAAAYRALDELDVSTPTATRTPRASASP